MFAEFRGGAAVRAPLNTPLFMVSLCGYTDLILWQKRALYYAERLKTQLPANIVLPANLKQFKMAIKNIDFSYALIGKDWV